ncbi:MAG TPA: TAXI family TRAP transporter solute-binding subunit [Gemmataceae bacterium]
MNGWRKLRLSRRMTWVAAVLFVVSLGLSVWLIGSPPPRTIVLATGDPDGGFAALGRVYKVRLERMGLQVQLRGSRGSIDNLHFLQRREADVAFVQSGAVGSLDRTNGLCSLAVVGVEPLWIFYRSDRWTEPPVSLRDLRGRKLVLGPPVSGTDALSRLLLKEYGITESNTTFLNLSMGQERQALVEGQADAVLLVCSCDAPVIGDLLHADGIRLVSLRDHQEALARRYRYLSPVVLPRGVLDPEGDLPRQSVNLLAPRTVLTAREDLHPRVVEQLLMAAQEIHSSGDLLDAPGQFPSLEGVELPPHVAADKFMRSGESFVSRLLPYWGVRLVWQMQLLLLPLLSLLLPFWRAVPMLYGVHINRILKRHYTALREAEDRIQRCEDAMELRKHLEALDGLRGNLETLSRKLPAPLQRDVYDWRQHVALVRHEGRERLRRLEKSPNTPE